MLLLPLSSSLSHSSFFLNALLSLEFLSQESQKPLPGIRVWQLSVSVGWGMPTAPGCGALQSLESTWDRLGGKKWALKCWVCSWGQIRQSSVSGREGRLLQGWSRGWRPYDTVTELEKGAPFGLVKRSCAGFPLSPLHCGVTPRGCRICKSVSAALSMGHGSCEVPVHTHTLYLHALFSCSDSRGPQTSSGPEESNYKPRRELSSMYEKPKSKQCF